MERRKIRGRKGGEKKREKGIEILPSSLLYKKGGLGRGKKNS